MNTKLIMLTAALLATTSYILIKNRITKRDDTIFVVGTASGYAPFVSVDERGEYEGFDIDVASLLTQKMGKKLKIKDLGSMATLFIALQQNSIDAIMWGISITQDRLKNVTLIRYGGENMTSYPMLFWQKIPDCIKCIEDMIGLTVCVEPASAQDAALSRYPFITKKPTERVDDALLNIKYGRADAAFVEPAIARKFKNRYPEIQMMNVPLAPEDQEYGVGIAIKKENALLAQQVQQAVDQMISEGTIKKLETTWEIS